MEDGRATLEQLVKKEINVLNDYSYKNVKYGNILASNITEYLYNYKNYIKITSKMRIKWLYRFLYKMIAKYRYNGNQSIDNKYVFSYFYPDRKDHLELFNKVTQQFNNSEIEKVTYNNLCKKIQLDKKIFLRVRKLKLIDVYKSLRCRDIYSKEFCLFIIGIIYQASFFIDDVNKLISNVKPLAYISFFDVHIYDNIITQIMKNNKVVTFTLEHGIYFYYNKSIQNVNILAYVNFISDYMLLWGNYSKAEMIKGKIAEKKLIVVGNPLYHFKSIGSHGDDKFFILLLSQETYYESNIKMIEICNEFAEKTNLKYKVKLHPSNNIKKYKKLFVNRYCAEIYKNEVLAKELIKQGRFIILHSTTLYIDALFYGKRVYRYNDMYALPFDLANDKFQNLYELLGLIDRKAGFDVNLLNEYVKTSSITEYRDTVMDIVKNKKLNYS